MKDKETRIKRLNDEGLEYFIKWKKVAANMYMLGLEDRIPSDSELLTKIMKSYYEIAEDIAFKKGHPIQFAFPASDYEKFLNEDK